MLQWFMLAQIEFSIVAVSWIFVCVIAMGQT